MATDATETGTPPDVMADVHAVAEHAATGKPLDPAVARRVYARAAQARQQVLDAQGVQDVGVRIIREIRGDLPQSSSTSLTHPSRSSGKSPKAIRHKRTVCALSFRQGVHDLLAPHFFPQELAHALTRAERQGRIAVGQAVLFWADAMTTQPRLLPATLLTPRAIDISSATRVGVYDCLYLAPAEQEGCELVTADDKLVRNLQTQFPFIVSLASLP